MLPVGTEPVMRDKFSRKETVADDAGYVIAPVSYNNAVEVTTAILKTNARLI